MTVLGTNVRVPRSCLFRDANYTQYTVSVYQAMQVLGGMLTRPNQSYVEDVRIPILRGTCI